MSTIVKVGLFLAYLFGAVLFALIVGVAFGLMPGT